MGGTVEASAAQALVKGANSRFGLPLIVERQAASDEPVVATAEDSVPQLRILVVDDNEDNANTLGLMLRIWGHEVQVANDGLAAIEIAATFRPHIVLLDIGMPKLDGYETCRRIRQEPWGKEMALVAQTGWGQEDDRRRTQAAGFDHHLVKPGQSRRATATLGRAR